MGVFLPYDHQPMKGYLPVVSPLHSVSVWHTRAWDSGMTLQSTVYSLQSLSLSVSQSTVSLLWKEITVLRLQIERACKRSFLIYIACLCEQKSKAGQRNVQNSFTNTGYHIPQFQQKYVPSSKYSCSVVRHVNYVHCQRIRGAIGLIVLNT